MKPTSKPGYKIPHVQVLALEAPDFEKVRSWHEGRLDDDDWLALALDAPREAVTEILSNARFRDALCIRSDAGSTTRLFPAKMRVGLAAAHALHFHARLPLMLAAEIVGRHWNISQSVARTLDFIPDHPAPVRLDTGDRIHPDVLEGKEADPLMWFTPYASEMLPLAAVDEYIHVVNGRELFWESPLGDAYELIDRLHNASLACDGVLVAPEARDVFLECLVTLRHEPQRQKQWLGVIRDGEYHFHDPSISADERPTTSATSRDCESGSGTVPIPLSVISVNISLAARAMKRRALGLEVTFRQ